MALQPATRRLLTEAAAATAYQPKGTYQPAGSYLTTAQLGAASGVASLGADGKVPTAQLPATQNLSVVKATAGAAHVGVGTDPDLTFSNVTAGTYSFELFLRWNTPASAGSYNWTLTSSVASIMDYAYMSLDTMSTTPAGRAAAGVTVTQSVSYASPATASATSVITVRGSLYLDATTTLTIQFGHNTQSSSLMAGSGFRLVKL